MTDYLEQMFAVSGERAEEAVQEMGRRVLSPEEPVVRRFSGLAQEPVQEGSREWLSLRRPSHEREGEGLERRLRRESRRYDSGFYQY